MPKSACSKTEHSSYTALEEEIFYLSQGQRITDVHHHREADHLGRTVEITEGILHLWTLCDVLIHLRPIYSDNASLCDNATWKDLLRIFVGKP